MKLLSIGLLAVVTDARYMAQPPHVRMPIRGSVIIAVQSRDRMQVLPLSPPSNVTIVPHAWQWKKTAKGKKTTSWYPITKGVLTIVSLTIAADVLKNKVQHKFSEATLYAIAENIRSIARCTAPLYCLTLPLAAVLEASCYLLLSTIEIWTEALTSLILELSRIPVNVIRLARYGSSYADVTYLRVYLSQVGWMSRLVRIVLIGPLAEGVVFGCLQRWLQRVADKVFLGPSLRDSTETKRNAVTTAVYLLVSFAFALNHALGPISAFPASGRTPATILAQVVATGLGSFFVLCPLFAQHGLPAAVAAHAGWNAVCVMRAGIGVYCKDSC